MPNWCENRLTITHKDADVIDNLMAQVRSDEDERLFQHIKPMPDELRNTVVGTGQDEQTTKYDGHTNWYDWSCDNWGTKWDACHLSWSQIDDNTIEFDFDTAWSPPFGVYEALAEQGFTVEAYYVEYGMMFAGEWYWDADNPYEEGDYDYLNDYCPENEHSGDISEYVPEGADKVFGITEQLAEWAEEEKEYADA